MSPSDAPKKLTRKDFTSDQDVRWCPGCGDYAILATMQRTLPTVGADPAKTVFVSGIGCSSRFPYYMNTYGFHSIHGRAPAFATGLKLTNPELDIWLITGDGDGLSIGGNHLMHVLRRNVDVQLILFNNRIYGLTKGQYSPTSKVGTRAASTPSGSVDHPVNPLALALGAGATFIARCTDTDAKTMAAILKAAHEHPGTTFVELLQNCPVFNDGIWDAVKDDAVNHQIKLVEGEPMRFGPNGSKGIRVTDDLEPEIVEVGDGPGQVPVSQLLVHKERGSKMRANLLARMTHPDFPVPVGVLHSEVKPTYETMAHQKVDDAIAQQGTGDLQKLLFSGMTWEVDADGVKA